MARRFKISRSAAAAMLGDGMTAGLGGLLAKGTVRVYDGRDPKSCDDPVAAATTLLELLLPDPVFAPATDNVLEGMNLPSALGRARGTAMWWRAFSPSGGSVCQGTAGEKRDDADLTIDHKTITVGTLFAITEWRIVQPLG